MWRFFLGLAVILPLSSCALMFNKAGYGWIYMDTAYSQTATAQANIKKGESCASSILGIIATGDASIGAAAKAGGIVSVGAVDERDMAILMGAYWQHCTIVRGK